MTIQHNLVLPAGRRTSPCMGLLMWLTTLLATAALPGQHTWPIWMSSQVPDSGIPEPARVWRSHLAVAGAAVYAFWGVEDPANPTLWSRSLDYGRTWSPMAPFRPGTVPVSGALTRLIANGTDVLIHWVEWSATGSRSLLAVSSDRGTNWTVRPGPLSTEPNHLFDDGGTILWSSGPWLFSSTDRGASWQGPRPIGGPGTQLAQVQSVRLHFAGGVLQAAWDELVGSATQAFYSRSTDLGVTWLPTARALAAASSWSQLADLLVTPTATILAWSDASGYYVDRSLDAGLSWLPAPSAVATLPAGEFPICVSDGESVLAVWQEPPIPGPYRLRCVRSPDHGRTWAAPPIDMFSLSLSGRYIGISGLHSENGWVAVTVRHLNRSWLPQSLEYYRLVTRDGGVTWSGAGGAIEAECQGVPFLASNGTYLGGIWQNELPLPYINGYGNCLFDWFAGARPLGGGAAGTGGSTPALTIDKIPTYGFDSELQLRGGLPGAAAILSFGTLRSPIAFLGGQLRIDPVVNLFVTLDGPTGAMPGGVDHSFRVHFGVPADFCWQAFVLDPGASGGVAMSEGIEVRVY